jgi:hypothetical protein
VIVKAGPIGILNTLLTDNLGTELSVATTTKESVVAAAVGVPLMMPVLLFKISPAGSVPSDRVQVKGAVPPVTTIAAEYGV